MKRPDGRAADTLRPISIETNFVPYAEGSVLIAAGNTRVLCNASVEEKVPQWLTDKGSGWVTAEYSLLPRSTHTRTQRELSRPSGRTQEIQRLIGRSLRAALALEHLGPRMVTLDCDVIQADGGTRTIAITGAYVALVLALEGLIGEKKIDRRVFRAPVAAVSVGMISGEPLLDLSYTEDSSADVDANVVCDRAGGLIEVQSTAERLPLSREMLSKLLDLAELGLAELFEAQERAVQCHTRRKS